MMMKFEVLIGNRKNSATVLQIGIHVVSLGRYDLFIDLSVFLNFQNQIIQVCFINGMRRFATSSTI